MKKRILSLLLLACLTLPAFALGGAAPEKSGSAPVAENLELETFRGVSVGGRLAAVDPDGDLCGFEIATPPTKGEIRLEKDGSFVYTPAAGRRGRDYFGYRALDAAGNRSQEATVVIRLKRQTQPVSYADMAGSGAAYAAALLAEEGVFRGRSVAGKELFEPEAAVTRAEFLAMCMALADMPPLSGVSRTGFADDDAIETWAKPYVAAALMDGVVSGYARKGGPVFLPEREITVWEAAAVLDRLLGVTDVSVGEPDGAVPAWAAQPEADLRACRLLPESLRGEEALTRADCAVMLAAAQKLLEMR